MCVCMFVRHGSKHYSVCTCVCVCACVRVFACLWVHHAVPSTKCNETVNPVKKHLSPPQGPEPGCARVRARVRACMCLSV